jgi:large subunit ribosomal protein L3
VPGRAPWALFFWPQKFMLNTILGSKKNMSQSFVQGTRIPVTWIQAGPCVVTQLKNDEKDGYWAVQLGFGERKLKHTTKPLKGHLRGVTENGKTPRFLREVRLEKEPEFKVGDKVKVSDVFKKGDVVAVSGTSKGKGFAGVMKRWGFAGGPRTHGQSDRPRSPGSIGQGTDPGRVWKGKKMAGRMGNQTTTISNLVVVDVDEDRLAVSGPIPGRPDALLMIRKIKSGKLDELVEEVPQVEVQQVEEETEDDTKGDKSEAENDTGKKKEDGE